MRIKQHFCFFILLSFQVIIAIGQPIISWQKCYGGSSLDVAYSISLTPDQGFIVVGESGSNDGDVSGNHAAGIGDYWLLKLDSMGQIQWQKCFGGTNSETPCKVETTYDGGYIIAGIATSIDGDVTNNHSNSMDVWIVKVDSNGIIEWQSCYGGASTDRAISIKQSPDSGYIILADVMSNDGDITLNHGDVDIWVLKISSTGGLEWQKTFGGSSTEGAADILSFADGTYAFIGHTNSNDGDLAGSTFSYCGSWIVQLTNNGSIERQVRAVSSDTAITASSFQYKNGYYYVEGFNDGFPINRTGLCLAKIDTLGNFLKWHSFADWDYDQYSKSGNTTSDSGFLIIGLRREYLGGDANWYVLKADSNFNFEWQFAIGVLPSDDYAMSGAELENGRYVIAGFDGDGCDAVPSYPDEWIIKLEDLNSDIIDQNNNSNIKSTYDALTQSLYLKWEFKTTSSLVFEIFNYSGARIRSDKYSDQDLTNLNISCVDLPTGIYIFKLSSPLINFTSKFLKF